jgi:hypothetical protein
MATTTTIKKGGSLRLHLAFTATTDKFNIPKGARISYMYAVNKSSTTALEFSSFDLNLGLDSIFELTVDISSLATGSFLDLKPFLKLDGNSNIIDMLSYDTSGEDEITFNYGLEVTSAPITDLLLIIGLDTIF